MPNSFNKFSSVRGFQLPAGDYFAHIDGLRAFAVLGVLIFHVNERWLPGGYIGVDVFFVISGFLVQKIVSDRMGERNFDLLDFYVSRVRRIFPALFFVTAVSMVVSFALLTPDKLEKVSEAVMSTMALVPNIYFWSQAGYFGHDFALLKHFWSLGVEIQFYILFPIFLIVIDRFFKVINSFSALICLFCLSLLTAEWGYRYESTANFYLLPSRIFEFCAGSLTFLATIRFSNRLNGLSGQKVLAVLSNCSLIALILCFFFIQ